MGQRITTGEAAKRYGVSVPIIVRLCNDKRIRSFQIPPGGHRRIDEDELAEDMEALGIPKAEQK